MVELCFCLTMHHLSCLLREWVKENREMAKIFEVILYADGGTKFVSVNLKHVLTYSMEQSPS
jgi:hypothetical protein